jgi:hypothetical protein
METSMDNVTLSVEPEWGSDLQLVASRRLVRRQRRVPVRCHRLRQQPLPRQEVEDRLWSRGSDLLDALGRCEGGAHSCRWQGALIRLASCHHWHYCLYTRRRIMDDQKKLRFRLHLDIDVMVATKAEAEAVTQIFHAGALLVATQFPTRFDPDIFAREGDDGVEVTFQHHPDCAGTCGNECGGKEVSKTAN